MNRGIILFLAAVVLIGFLGLYALERGPFMLVGRPSEERIAFISDRGGHPDVWTMRVDGTDERRITDDPADDRMPVWSPDGSEIAYISDRAGGVYQVFVSTWNGKYMRQLTSGTGTKDMPCWSPDGRHIAFLASGKVDLIGRLGGEEMQILPPEGREFLESQPFSSVAWSPVRRSLAVVQEADAGQSALALEEIDSENLDETPFGITIAGSVDVVWAPSGSRVAAAFVNRDGESGLLVTDLGLVTAKDIFVRKGDTLGPAAPAWSPDGRSIAFEMWTIKGGHKHKCIGIYTVSPTLGAKPVKIVSGDAREPCWSPDGKRLVYALARPDGGRDIWRVNADGSEAVNLTRSKGDNYRPDWSRAHTGRLPLPGRRCGACTILLPKVSRRIVGGFAG